MNGSPKPLTDKDRRVYEQRTRQGSLDLLFGKKAAGYQQYESVQPEKIRIRQGIAPSYPTSLAQLGKREGAEAVIEKLIRRPWRRRLRRRSSDHIRPVLRIR